MSTRIKKNRVRKKREERSIYIIKNGVPKPTPAATKALIESFIQKNREESVEFTENN